MAFRGDFPRFTERELAVGTEKRTECAELEPAGIELTPFLHVIILLACICPYILTCHITVLDAESSDIHCPIWDTADREVESCRNLGLHIFPTGCNVTAPCRCRVSLETSETASGKEEHTLVRIYATLTVIDRISVHDRVRIEELSR